VNSERRMAPTSIHLQLDAGSPRLADDEQLGAAAAAAKNGNAHLLARIGGQELGVADADGYMGRHPNIVIKRGSSCTREEVVCAVLQSLLRRSPSTRHSILHSDSPFWLLDVGRTQQLMAEWTAAFPRVRPFYAVKCNNHPLFLRTLASAQAGFDCASKEELQQITSLGVSSERIVFANACKLQSHMEFATAAGVHLTTFDSETELHKIKKSMAPNKVKLLLRIETNDEGATIRLSSKYGAYMEEVPALLRSAREAGLAVVGVSFHIGSGAMNPNAFEEAIANARSVFELGNQLLEKPMYVLDIGGGFCSSGEELKEGSTGGGLSAWDVAPMINKALDGYFPDQSTNIAGVNGCNSCSDEKKIEIIAEPGRYFACAPFTLVTRIFGKRVRGSRREYWINDGAHHSFTMILLPHNTPVPPPIPFACASKPYNTSCQGLPLFPTNVFGPTCSALDTLLKGHPLPELEIGDLLAFPFMGAYTNSLATSFNGFAVSSQIPAFGFAVAE
ncbi:hypothetical protein GOP47_0013996, partial [Adiantum capillus-veneris]